MLILVTTKPKQYKSNYTISINNRLCMYRPILTIPRDILQDTGFSVFQDVQTVPLRIDRIGQNMQEQTLIVLNCILLYIVCYIRL